MYIPHFVYSLGASHLGCFHVLAVGNNAAVNMAVQILFDTLPSVPLGICPEVEFLHHMVILFNFLRYLLLLYSSDTTNSV